MKKLLCTVVATAALTLSLSASQVLFTDVNIFDGTHDKLQKKMNVLVEDNLIKSISSKSIKHDKDAKVIKGEGRTLMPGLIDVHTHLMINNAPHISIYEENWSYVGAQAVAGSKAMLHRGFTTVRDVGGPVSGLKKAIDEGLVEGPRVLPSGGFISQTAGHGDLETSKHKLSTYFTGIPDKMEIFGWGYIADGVPEVQKAAREVLRSGATQIKVMAGGGVSSHFDPLDTQQYTLEELTAIVVEAEHWGTYVAVHAFNDKSVNTAIKAGVKSIEHGPLLTEDTLKLMAKKGVWLSPQAYVFGMTPKELNIVGTPSEAKMLKINRDSANLLRLAKKHNVKIAWGTDLFGPLDKQAKQPLEFRARAKFFTPVEILKQVTSYNAELLNLSGLRHPYREGALGEIKVGAYADILLIDGNPLKDIEIMTNPAKNYRVIMKDGVIYKNSLTKGKK